MRVENGMNLKHTYLLLSLAIALTACSSSDEIPVRQQYGTIKIKDIAMPQDSKIHYKKSMVLGPPDAWVGRLTYECSESTDYLWDFMQAEMARMGWTQLSGIRSTVSVLVFKRGGRVATAQIQERLIYGSNITVDVAPESNSSPSLTGSSGDYSSFSPMSPPPTSPLPSAQQSPGIQSLE